ncbi:PIN domain-containing protein [Egbenema bharatensis]|uniref:PIN domain-containing protein n=1 Tax=Egbenema bharatensis TaxID=3463334 RepID=UPI003A8BD1D5
MSDKVFFDTNIWIYFYSKMPVEKFQKIQELLVDPERLVEVSTQVLGELFHVLTRKKITSTSEANTIILELVNASQILEIDTPKVFQAIEIHSRYGYTYWDSLIIATALSSDCTTLYSEDMQHNQLLENKLRIINPFI